MGRNLDSQWASATANLLNGAQPSEALQIAFYNASVKQGLFEANGSNSALVNEIFLNIFGFGASTFEQTAWGDRCHRLTGCDADSFEPSRSG